MKKRSLRLAGLVSLLLLSGCGHGLLYTHTVQPLDTNLGKTARAAGRNKGDIKRFDVPLIVPPIDLAWDTNAIGEIARNAGMDSAEYADLETLSVLLGLWQQYTVHVYGSGAGGPRHHAMPVD